MPLGNSFQYFRITLTILCFLLTAFTEIFAQPEVQTSFESFADETEFTKTSWESDGFTVPWVNGFNQSRAYIDDAYAHTGTKSLRIDFPQGEYGPSNSGAQAPLMVTPASQYYISYWLRFSDNFSWGTSSEGGKLPGLSGGGRCSGCATCTGSNGFSARLMWRTGGTAVLYLYHMDKGGSCGDNLNLQLTPGVNFAFAKGQWYQIIERVKINTGNNFDGEVELWVNQQPALLVQNIRFVNNGDQVDNLYFSTFHGGSTSGWAPTVDCNIWFDDVMITANSGDVFPPLGFINPFKNTPAVKNTSATVQIYPQPMKAGEGFTIEISDPSKEILSMEWMDIYGKSVYLDNNQTMAGLKKVPALEKGFYILKVRLIDRMECRKVYIE